MTVIAIDTGARRWLAVVLAGATGELLEAVVEEGAPTVPALDRALGRLLPASGLEAVVVVTGPGSYTGLRAGMAAGLGLAHAAGLPLHGLSSLEATAHSASSDHGAILAVVDAGRGGAYVGRFGWADGARWASGPAERLSLEELSARSLPLATLDRIGLPGVEPGDPARALARAVPAALSRPPLNLTGLTATYMS